MGPQSEETWVSKCRTSLDEKTKEAPYADILFSWKPYAMPETDRA